MIVLGINGNFSREDVDLVPGMMDSTLHDASACLVKDGELICAVEEERLNRIKKTTKFPINAIKFCLDRAGVQAADVDAVAYYLLEETTDTVLNSLLQAPGEGQAASSRHLLKMRLKEEFDWDLPDEKLIYVPHHEAHATSAMAHSGFSDALAIVLDGAGDWVSGSIFAAEGSDLVTLRAHPYRDSLGGLYYYVTKYLGYGFGDEYKVMGLAPYGDPEAYRGVLDQLYTLESLGNYALLDHFVTVPLVLAANGVPARSRGRAFTQENKNLAAALQRTLETVVLHIMQYWAEETGAKKLAFSGGVAHNSSLNGRILEAGIFDEVFVHPASHDPGAAEGAALFAEQKLSAKKNRAQRLRVANFGPKLPRNQAIGTRLKDWANLVEFGRSDDVVGETADLLANGEVVGWAQGASEFGPRALGYRSILADARPAENKDRINAMVKKREGFRPFAPAVIVELADKYFEIPRSRGNHDFMSFVVPVRGEFREHLGAVTHVDGSARLQIVDRRFNETFHELISRFGGLTGTPVLLNTSFNNNAEPIVQDIDDVLTCFLTTAIDVLVVDDFIVRRRPEFLHGMGGLCLRSRPVTRLARYTKPDIGSRDAEVVHEIYLDYFNGPRSEISEDVYKIISSAHGEQVLSDLIGSEAERQDELLVNFFELWQERLLLLAPPKC